MTVTQFQFIAGAWPDLFEAASKTESLALSDPRTSCFYARRTLERTVAWLYKHDATLRLPYQEHLSALIHEPTFRNLVGPAVFTKTRILKELGNLAVHNQKPILESDAVTAVKELHHVLFWLARTYLRDFQTNAVAAFDPLLLPKTAPIPMQTREELKTLDAKLKERDEQLAMLLTDKTKLDAELQRLHTEIAAIKAANASQTDGHDYSEASTRSYFIDLLLKEAGWPLDQKRDREVEVVGMPNTKGSGAVDYVLWGDDGKPLGLVEAKRTSRDPRAGQQQAKLYADCLEQMFGQRPIIFYSNGYEHFIWDDTRYPPRPIQGFYEKSELELIIQRRTSRKEPSTASVKSEIVERHYQTRAIRRISEAFATDHDRKALVVMATGAGKTRTVIALCELLMRCNWVKRVLFLADRVALVKQAVNAFKKFLPESSPVNLVTEKEGEGRVFVSTYPTMMGLIDETRDDQRRFGVGHFDLVIIDEAHRSVYEKYRAIFEYFDSLLVGLTATPKEDINRDTYRLFDLEKGVPTDAYPLAEAVKDKFLVPARSVSVPLKFQREGIAYDDLSDEEKEEWDLIEWGDEDERRERVEAAEVNKWLFNADTVDRVLELLMTRGQKVAGGDRLGKTIIFAKNHLHAEYIAERFNTHYPKYCGEFARVIDFQVEYAQSLIDAFSQADKPPHIAISVDMLDTGIDVPEVVNLVFFKLVRSKTKFWQMVGRGTRLCPDLFGPGQHKQFFSIFDFCQNLEFFSENPEATDGAAGEPLSKRLFKSRVELIGALDDRILSQGDSPAAGVTELPVSFDDPQTNWQVRQGTASFLQREIASMNLDNFVVRPKRRFVEKFAKPANWAVLSTEARQELAAEVAGLPSGLAPEEEEAKRFDLLLLSLQLANLRAEPAFERLGEQVKAIAGLLEEMKVIPLIHAQLPLILDLQTDEWWQDVTIPMLEKARRRLRSLVKLIEKGKRVIIYTDFEDESGEGTEIELPEFAGSQGLEKFRAKARAFLTAHLNDEAVLKLRLNRPLAPSDLEHLGRLFLENGVGNEIELRKAGEESHGLGLFVRSLVGLERDAAKQVFAGFLSGKSLSANQIEFINLIIDHLTEFGAMEPEMLYESPFIDSHPHGVEGLFDSTDVDLLILLLNDVRQSAAA